MDVAWFRRTGQRRHLSGAGAEADWRLGILNVEACWRQPQNYGQIIGGALQTFTDAIPQAVKQSGNAPYVLTAPSVGQRPPTSGSSWTTNAGSAQILAGAPLLAGLLRVGACTVLSYMRYNGTLIGSYSPICIGNTASDPPWATMTNELSGTTRSVRAQGGFQVATGPAADNAFHQYGHTFSTPALTTWRDGVGGTPNVLVVNPAAVNVFSIGGLQRLTPAEYANATYYETLVVLRAMLAAEILAIWQRWVLEYGS